MDLTAGRLITRAQGVALRAALDLPEPVQRRLAGRATRRDGLTLDAETALMLRLRRVAREPQVEDLPLDEARPALVRQARLAGGHQPIGEVRSLSVDGGAGPLGARLYVPRTSSGPGLLVFFHGGGFCFGDLDSHDAPARFLAEHAAVRVLSVDYRLAPEHPFPAAYDDALAAYRWAVAHAEELGAVPGRIAVAGDSAGGNLAAEVALAAADEGLPCRLQALVYPMTDARGGTRSRELFDEGFYLTGRFIAVANDALLTDPAETADPRMSPLLRDPLPEGLAPAYVVTAGFDPLRDEGEAYADHLAAAGVPVDRVRHPGQIHGFFNVVGGGRVTRAAVRQVADRVRRALA